jgi:DNA-binding transcriptional MerR regulator
MTECSIPQWHSVNGRDARVECEECHVTYRVDDLARAAGTTTRNVRLYQERGLLPPPERRGRVGLYDEAHLARLRLITRLLERGYSLANIGELLSTWESGRDLTSVLGVEQVLTVPWNDEDPAPVTLTRLREALGPDFDTDAAERLVAIGLLQRQDARFRVPSPDLLRVAAELVQLGLPLAAVLQLAELLVQQLAVVARGFVTTVSASLGPPPEEVELTPAEVARMAAVANRLRPLAAVAVNRAFSVTMDRETIALLGARLAELRRG